MMKNEIEKVVRDLKADCFTEFEDNNYEDVVTDLYPYLKRINEIGGLNDNKKQDKIYEELKDFCDSAYFHVAECMWADFNDSYIEKTVNKIEEILVD